MGRTDLAMLCFFFVKLRGRNTRKTFENICLRDDSFCSAFSEASKAIFLKILNPELFCFALNNSVDDMSLGDFIKLFFVIIQDGLPK